jgi:alkylation response protein AidB-like acyl-CoA dehydrogenase
VSGTKIFISAGDHDFGDGAGTADGQVIHCVLARTPGAPEGTKGISLFLVPKFLVNEDGTLGELNNVGVDRIEDKMGCHGSPTCQMNFENSKGWLLGTKNQGMGHMFTFINTSRLGCAIQGSTAAELSHQGAVWCVQYSMRALFVIHVLTSSFCTRRAGTPRTGSPCVP